MAIRGGKKLPDKRGFVDGPGGYRGRDDRDPGFGDAGSSGNGTGTGGSGTGDVVGNVVSGTVENPISTNVTFGQPDPRAADPTYNPNLIGQYLGYYNPEYAAAPGSISNTPGNEYSALDQIAEIDNIQNNNFFSGMGGGIQSLASNFTPGRIVGSLIGNALFPGIGGLLGGYIGGTYGDDDPSNNFFGNLGENLKTDLADTVEFFKPNVKAIDPSLDTSGLTTADLTGSEITDTVDPVNEIGLGTLYGPKVTDISYQDPNALPDNPMFGPEDLQRKAGGSGYGLPGSDYTSPTAPRETVQRPTIADVTNKQTPKAMPMSYGDLNIYQSGSFPGLALTNPDDEANRVAMNQLIGNIVAKNPELRTYFSNPDATFRNIQPGIVQDITDLSNPETSYMDFADAIEQARAYGEPGVRAGFYLPGYNLDAEGMPTRDTDQSIRNLSTIGPQQKPTYDFGNTISVVDDPDKNRMASTALEEAMHFDSFNSPLQNTLGQFDYVNNYGIVPGAAFTGDEGEERMIKEILGVDSNPINLVNLGYAPAMIGASFPSQIEPYDMVFPDDPVIDNLTEQDRSQFRNQFLSETGFAKGGLIPPMSGPMSDGLGNLFKMK
jgi:hypothetical protein|tara:strand:+ start:1015 stop:2832 length:1818 start_codon:yes stop_codon:yes gene_type:complete